MPRRRWKKEAAAAAALADGVKVLLSGIDTLHLHTVAKLDPKWEVELEAKKREAIACRDSKETQPGVRVGGVVFHVRPNATRHGPYLLENDGLVVTVNPEPMANMATVRVELRSTALWSLGYLAAGERAEAVMRELIAPGQALRCTVSRLDVTADFTGWLPEEWFPGECVSRAGNLETHHFRRKLTGWRWGAGGAVVCRLYDKVREITVKADGKEKWLPPMWKRKGWDGTAPVWRLEFQLRREVLREFFDAELLRETFKGGDESSGFVADLWSTAQLHVAEVWRALLIDWLSWRAPRTATERKRLHPVWKVLCDADFNGVVGSRHLYRRKRAAAEARTYEQIRGHMSRAVAERFYKRWERGGREPDFANLETELYAICRDVLEHEAKPGKSVHEKSTARLAELKAAHRAHARPNARKAAA